MKQNINIRTGRISGERVRLEFGTEVSNLRINLLGTPTVYLGEKPVHLTSDDLLKALSYLALQALPVSQERLVRLIQPQNPEEFLKNLRDFARTSGALEFFAGETLRLHAVVDVLLLEYAVQDGYFSDALALYHHRTDQTFMEGLEPGTSELQEWYCIEQAKVQLLYQDALRGHYQVLAMADDIQGAIRVAKVLLELDPLDEYTHQRIMQLELFRGNLKGAMQQFETCCQKLSSLLGVEPLAETRELADIIDALLFDQQLFSEDDSFKEEFKDGLF
ncbi:MAG: bacterial transcriptional activator domain-containing protein [Trueperaceae bacterium]|nr:bacterial transcriptional activator domain-containing protein [Trueperaceae bacterium]